MSAILYTQIKREINDIKTCKFKHFKFPESTNDVLPSVFFSLQICLCELCLWMVQGVRKRLLAQNQIQTVTSQASVSKKRQKGKYEGQTGKEKMRESLTVSRTRNERSTKMQSCERDSHGKRVLIFLNLVYDTTQNLFCYLFLANLEEYPLTSPRWLKAPIIPPKRVENMAYHICVSMKYTYTPKILHEKRRTG